MVGSNLILKEVPKTILEWLGLVVSCKMRGDITLLPGLTSVQFLWINCGAFIKGYKDCLGRWIEQGCIRVRSKDAVSKMANPLPDQIQTEQLLKLAGKYLLRTRHAEFLTFIKKEHCADWLARNFYDLLLELTTFAFPPNGLSSHPFHDCLGASWPHVSWAFACHCNPPPTKIIIIIIKKQKFILQM
jgi:hypothetical protein